MRAYLRAKRERIPAVVERLPESKWFARAVELNVPNGRSFTTQDKAFIANRLDREGWNETEQAKLLQMPIESLQRIKVDRLVRAQLQTGKRGGGAGMLVLKAPARGLVGRAAQRAQRFQAPLATASVVSALDQTIAVLKMGLVDMGDEAVAERIEEIRELLKGL
jgi:hypothetical protein